MNFIELGPSHSLAKQSSARHFVLDEAQLNAARRLQTAYAEWQVYKAKRNNSMKRWLNRPPLPRGVYLWGGVGRGKSFLLDSFYMAVPVVRKLRIHFHEFMKIVHGDLDTLKKISNPLEQIAENFSKKYRLICFDEFHIADIADAMLLYNLLDALFKRGVVFYMTSNYAPDKLYPDGLHRDRLLPAIALIKQKMDVLQVDAGIDYRQRVLEKVPSYYTPLNSSAEQALNEAFSHIAETSDENPLITIQHRHLKAKRRAGGIIWFDFATLCDSPRSQNDYLEIAGRFHTLVLSNVPKLNAGMFSAARRFTWLVDILYDRKIKLLISAAAPPQDLYREGSFANEFQRTSSRLIEMQSKEYMGQQRLDK